MIPSRTIQENFPHWSLGQCRAYRAGAMAYDRGYQVPEGFSHEDDLDEDEDDDLTGFWLRGYADSMGEDAESEDWWEEIEDWTIATRWWEES